MCLAGITLRPSSALTPHNGSRPSEKGIAHDFKDILAIIELSLETGRKEVGAR